jgi:hypothetical protein
MPPNGLGNFVILRINRYLPKGAHTMSNHTPGPWAVSNDQLGQYINAGGKVIAAIPDGSVASDYVQDVCNARLIAAAPDLLAACESACLTVWAEPQFKHLADKLRATIAKAKGE